MWLITRIKMSFTSFSTCPTLKEKYKFKAYRKYFVKIIILHKASFRLMIMIMVMIIFPILAITDWLWQIGISSSPKLHLDVPKSRLELIFLFGFQAFTKYHQEDVLFWYQMYLGMLMSYWLFSKQEKNLILKQKWEERQKSINFFLVFNFFNNLLHINHRAKDSLFIAFILEQIFVYDIWNIYLAIMKTIIIPWKMVVGTK